MRTKSVTAHRMWCFISFFGISKSTKATFPWKSKQHISLDYDLTSGKICHSLATIFIRCNRCFTCSHRMGSGKNMPNSKMYCVYASNSHGHWHENRNIMIESSVNGIPRRQMRAYANEANKRMKKNHKINVLPCRNSMSRIFLLSIFCFGNELFFLVYE